MRRGRLSFLPFFAAVWAIILFVLTLDVHAGHLEPFKSVPVPQNNPQTPEKIELGK
ncbi:MAG TPA: hypothetical protein VEI28_02170 [Thermodesulfovibrionales bacterium]|nr:hypothetical protein [Thermodesulfovibrionales bacterium]